MFVDFRSREESLNISEYKPNYIAFNFPIRYYRCVDIKIVKGVGEGSTILSAFDAALKDAGVYNYNLITLSSIIPPHSKIKQVDKYITPDSEYGHRLYVVKAEMRSDHAGRSVAAGVGWYQLKDGRGLFVEHELTTDTKRVAQTEIKLRIINSLRDLCKFRELEFDIKKVKTEISVTKVRSKPACVLVLAVFKAESWD